MSTFSRMSSPLPRRPPQEDILSYETPSIESVEEKKPAEEALDLEIAERQRPRR